MNTALVDSYSTRIFLGTVFTDGLISSIV